MRKNNNDGKYTWLSIIFFIFLILIFIIWFGIKAIVVFSQSKLDISHPFVIDFYNKNENQVILFNQNKKTILLNFKNISHEDLTMIYEISVDKFINVPNPLASSINNDSIKKEVFSNSQINFFDKLKILYTLKTSSNNIQTFNFSYNSKSSDNLLPSVFIDSEIYQEGKTIAIINATGESGYASRLSGLLSNIGADVISTSASPDVLKNSSIVYSNEKSYTLAKISKILNINPVKSENTILADIVITLGKDQIGTGKY